MNEIEKLLRQDSSQKKKIGNSIKYRKSTRKGSSKKPLLTQSYFLSKKEKQELNGDVKVYNKDSILSAEEFEKLSLEEQKDSLTIWRNLFTTEVIKEKMGVNNTKFYTYIKELGIPSVGRRKKIEKEFNLNDFDEVYKTIKNNIILSDREKPTLSYRRLTDTKPKEIKKLLVVNYIEAYKTISNLVNKYKELGDKDAKRSFFYNFTSRLRTENEYDKILELNDRLCKRLAIDRKQKEIIKSALDEIEEEKLDSNNIENTIEENITPITNIQTDEVENTIEENDKILSDIKVKMNGFNLTIDGYYTSEDIIRKLTIVIDELENNNGINKLNVDLIGM